MRTLVTGGRSEMGLAIAKKRKAMGDEVLVTASSEVTLEEAQKIYSPLGIEVALFNLTEPAKGSESLLEWCRRGVEGVVFNAAPETRVLKRLHEFEESEIRAALDAHFIGNFWLLKAVLPAMMQQKFGRLVFISSMTVYGSSRYPAYALCKSGLEGLFVNVAVDYGEFNITANILRPGFIATKRTERFWKRSDYLKKVADLIPMRRLGQAEDVAEAIQPMLSSTCYMNGATVNCGGGIPSVRMEALLGRS